jgi:hypothetical protein
LFLSIIIPAFRDMSVMTQNRGVPTASVRPGEDFEWVNSWAEASGFKAARNFAAAPAKPVTPPPVRPATLPIKPVAPASTPVPARAPATDTQQTFPVASDQLACDIAEIEAARDAIIAAERTGPFALTAPKTAGARRLLRRQDAKPVLIGAMLAIFMLVVYGAVASLLAFGR